MKKILLIIVLLLALAGGGFCVYKFLLPSLSTGGVNQAMESLSYSYLDDIGLEFKAVKKSMKDAGYKDSEKVTVNACYLMDSVYNAMPTEELKQSFRNEVFWDYSGTNTIKLTHMSEDGIDTAEFVIGVYDELSGWTMDEAEINAYVSLLTTPEPEPEPEIVEPEYTIDDLKETEQFREMAATPPFEWLSFEDGTAKLKKALNNEDNYNIVIEKLNEVKEKVVNKEPEEWSMFDDETKTFYYFIDHNKSYYLLFSVDTTGKMYSYADVYNQMVELDPVVEIVDKETAETDESAEATEETKEVEEEAGEEDFLGGE